MFSKKHNHLLIIFYVVFLCILSTTAFSQTGTSVYYKNFAHHNDGELCMHTPPEATFTAYLNRDQSQILLENAPRWDNGEPNIAGNGTFGVELGNFNNPPLVVGDSVFVRFTCNATQQQGVLADSVTGIPWFVFPAHLTLTPLNLPSPPPNVRLEINASSQRVIRWNQVSGVSYSVYRRAVADTLSNGDARMLYTRLAHNLNSDHFIDTTSSTDLHGYVVIPKSGAGYGSHSREVVDFPLPPHEVEAAVAYTNPFKVSVIWQSPQGQTNLLYRVYRDTASGVPIDPAHFVDQTSDLFILDSLVSSGQTYFYRVAAVNQLGVVSEPSEEDSVTVQVFANGDPDLDILHISRSPKYLRFDIVYDPPGYNPHPRPGTGELKHYPEVGEMMTYTAVIRNSGGSTVEGFDLFWYVDSALIQIEQFGQLFPRQRVSSTFQMPWGSQPSRIHCEVQPTPSVGEVTTQNNSLRIRSNALSFRFHAEQNILDLFESNQNPMGSYSFEDWAQVQLNQMKTFFAQAQYPNVTPNGVPEAVFLDTVVYYDNGQLPSGGTHAPASLLWDGQWGFTGDPNAINYFRNIVLGQNNGMDWALLHELGHQLGLIDLYNQDVQESELQVVEPRTGQRPPLQPVAWDVLYYSSRQPYLMHTNFQAGLSDHSAGGLMRNLSQRRGYFGDYLADIPDDNTLIIERPNGNRVGNADIWVYQQQDNTVPNIPKFRGQTDSVGAYLFPHTTDSLYEGGISVANPFSTIYSPSPHVVGTNSVLFVRVAKGDSVGYGFIDVCDFNVAYWAGHQNSASYTLTISQWFHMPATGIDDKSNVVPKTYELFQNYPNPFNPSTQIKYQLPRPSQVRLVIYNVLGEKIHTLVDTKQSAGVYSVTWDGRSESGVAQGSGVYIYRLTAADKVFVRKALLIK